MSRTFELLSDLPAADFAVLSTPPTPAQPSTTASDGKNGRDTRGKFTAGNRCAVGNPFAAKVARLRSLMLDAVSEEDLKAIIEGLVGRAKAGDPAAIKILLDHVLGRPVPVRDPDEVQRETETMRARAYAKEHGFISMV
jgi:hypothetical protein